MTEKHIFIEIQGLLKNYEGFYAKATEIFAQKERRMDLIYK